MRVTGILWGGNASITISKIEVRPDTYAKDLQRENFVNKPPSVVWNFR